MHGLRPGRRLWSAALYDGGVTVAILLILTGWVIYLSQRPHPPPARVTVVERSVPPGPPHVPPGHAKRPARIRVLTLTPAVATRYEVRYREGVLVVEVAPQATVGLRRLDIVVAVNGRRVRHEEDLRRWLRHYRHDGRVEVVVVREGRLVPVRVAVEDF